MTKPKPTENYTVQEHRVRDCDKDHVHSQKCPTRVKARTLWSRARQAKKSLGLSGRQFVKGRKQWQRLLKKSAKEIEALKGLVTNEV